MASLAALTTSSIVSSAVTSGINKDNTAQRQQQEEFDTFKSQPLDFGTLHCYQYYRNLHFFSWIILLCLIVLMLGFISNWSYALLRILTIATAVSTIGYIVMSRKREALTCRESQLLPFMQTGLIF